MPLTQEQFSCYFFFVLFLFWVEIYQGKRICILQHNYTLYTIYPNRVFNLMMLPVQSNANTVINENKPSDATEVLAYYNREQYGVNPYFMVLNTQKLLQVLMKKHLLR
jgi:hypothetical protein